MADPKTTKPDILVRLRDLHKQAVVERSHYYTGSVVHDAIDEIERLRAQIDLIRCTWEVYPVKMMQKILSDD